MTQPSVHEVTQLLQAWGDGDQCAPEKLMPFVYDELHQVAHRYMAHQPTGHTLQTTALVNEVYLRLVNFREVSWQNRAHFFAVCARLMRQALIDFARPRRYLKRGGGARHVSLDEALVVSREALLDLLALDDAGVDGQRIAGARTYRALPWTAWSRRMGLPPLHSRMTRRDSALSSGSGASIVRRHFRFSELCAGRTA